MIALAQITQSAILRVIMLYTASKQAEEGFRSLAFIGPAPGRAGLYEDYTANALRDCEAHSNIFKRHKLLFKSINF